MISQTIKLSKTGKMPCMSFSLPAQACKVGAKLAKVEGSVCYNCYALKGMYRFPNVKAPRQLNLESLPDDSADWSEWVRWSDVMAQHLIKNKVIKNGFFRWHDSGDLQGMSHLHALVDIAHLFPTVNFWLPTKEKGLISQFLNTFGAFPDNLIVRLSAAMVDGEPVNIGVNTCTVHKENAPIGFVCNAPANDGKCGDCRACWDKSVLNVSYAFH